MDIKRQKYSEIWDNADDVQRYAFLDHYRHCKNKGEELFAFNIDKSYLDKNETETFGHIIRQLFIGALFGLIYTITIFLDIRMLSDIFLFLALIFFVGLGGLIVRHQTIKDQNYSISNRIRILEGYRRFARLHELNLTFIDTGCSDENLEDQIKQLDYDLSRDDWIYISNYKYNSSFNYLND